MNSQWQAKRTKLNHDWLKNDFLRRLRAFVSRVEDGAQDAARLEEFACKHWPEWRRHSHLIRDMLIDGEECLSPRQYFACLPLSACPAEVKSWLPNLIHALWLVRTDIRRHNAEAQCSLNRAEALFDELSPILQHASQNLTSDLAKSVGQLREFEAAAKQLGESIGRLPHHVEVV